MDLTSAAANLQLPDFYHFLRPLYKLIPTVLSPYKRRLAEVKMVENGLFFKLKDEAKGKIQAGKIYPSMLPLVKIVPSEASADGLA